MANNVKSFLALFCSGFWLVFARAAAPSSDDIWDLSRGTVITRSTDIRAGFEAGDAFGGHFPTLEPTDLVFSDDHRKACAFLGDSKRPRPCRSSPSACSRQVTDNLQQRTRVRALHSESEILGPSDYDLTLYLTQRPYQFRK
jgi:hypothetical protein